MSEPDIVQTALAKVDGASGVMIGDSVYDVLAAGRCGIPTIAVRTGGFGTDELQDAGASHVFDTRRAAGGAAQHRPAAPDRGRLRHRTDDGPAVYEDAHTAGL